MKRIAVLLAVALAIGGGTARGDDAVPVAAGVVPLPSPGVPNLDGALVVAPTWLEPPAVPVELSPEQLQALWEAAGAAYGVPWQVLAAINKVESNFGRNMGPSSAGAIGWMQFMPSTWLSWGTDADGNGVADPWNPQDAIYSAARYLNAAGGSDMPRAIFAYNHADWYVTEVLDLARLYGYDGSSASDPSAEPIATTVEPAPAPAVTLPASAFSVEAPPTPAADSAAAPADDSNVFALDQLQERLEAAGQAVATANTAYQEVAGQADELARDEQDLLQRAATASLLSDQLAYQKQAVQVSLESQEAQFRTAQLQDALEQGKAELRSLREQARAAAFNKTAAKVLAEPIEATAAPTPPLPQPTAAVAEPKWVFPVGGGPSTVSVGHTHHDYPAADIAAPEGAPVYALGDARVLHAWSTPDERCGIGFTLQTTDGQIWTYCHLSYLDPSVTPGAELAAGAPVGLVGMTGHATGPHLHLQLQPPRSYPQEQDWFQSFAGTAFRWQEAPTQAPAPAAPPVAAPVAPPVAETAETQPTVAQGLVFRIVQSN